MNIQGLQKTTLLDYPGHVAATVFVGGCNFRCPFCHNMNLVLNNDSPLMTTEELLVFLNKRKGILDGVCITGGEPTLYSDLYNLISSVKDLGYLIKLDTNGSNPEMVSLLINNSLIDYIAMDIKSSLNEYPIITGVSNIDTKKILETINMLKSSTINYEFRTTFIKEYHNALIVDDIGKLLSGATNYYIQSFKDSDFVPNHNLNSFSKEELLSFRQQLLTYIPNVEIRGVDL